MRGGHERSLRPVNATRTRASPLQYPWTNQSSLTSSGRYSCTTTPKGSVQVRAASRRSAADGRFELSRLIWRIDSWRGPVCLTTTGKVMAATASSTSSRVSTRRVTGVGTSCSWQRRASSYLSESRRGRSVGTAGRRKCSARAPACSAANTAATSSVHTMRGRALKLGPHRDEALDKAGRVGSVLDRPHDRAGEIARTRCRREPVLHHGVHLDPGASQAADRPHPAVVQRVSGDAQEQNLELFVERHPRPRPGSPIGHGVRQPAKDWSGCSLRAQRAAGGPG